MKVDANDIHRQHGVIALRRSFDAAPEMMATPTTETIHLECAADIQQIPVEWIWKGRIARGKIMLIGGDPELGKSQIVIDMIARCTRGGSWPDGGAATTGSCVILSAEDAPADTLCPRLDMAGADLRRVHFVRSVSNGDGRRRSFNLQQDLEALGETISRLGDVVLVDIDPITAYMGDGDSHRTTDVRAVLEPVDRFAEQYQVAIIAITHPPKAAQSKAMHAFTGSLAFVAAPRLAFMVIEEPETDRRLLLPVKNNLGPKAAGLGYTIQPGINSKGINSSHIVWDSAPVTMTANEAITAVAEANRRGGAGREAEEFLRDRLADGPVPAAKVADAAKALSISSPTLRRAREKVGVIVEKIGFADGWMWRLP